MKQLSFLFLRLRWLNLPGALLVALLQRTPLLRVGATAEETLAAAPTGVLLRSAFATVASLGAVHALAGATQFVVSKANPITGTVGTAITPLSFGVSGAPTIAGSYRLTGTLPPGLSLIGVNSSGILNATTGTISGTPTIAGTYTVQLRAYEFTNAQGDAFGPINLTFSISGGSPVITTQPATPPAAAVGGTVTLSVSATGSPAPTIQWQRNGSAIAGATSPTLTLNNFQPTDAGIYRAVVTNSGGTVTSDAVIVGVASNVKVVGSGFELVGDIQHPNGNVYDQVLLSGNAATIMADPGQVTRTSYIDLNDDIVQVEFAGAGTLTLSLDPLSVSGPATPIAYNQPTVSYMKGHATIVIAGANETTNVSVFSVGRGNAVNQTLFKDEVTYDGLADIALIAIASSNGKFGGVRTANANYFATKGLTGIYAPGVQFVGVDASNPAAAPVFMGDISAFDAATPVIFLGSAANTSVNGGDLLQANGFSVQVSGLSQLKFVDGSKSSGTLLPAQMNRGVLEQNGVNVTSQIVVNPSN